MFCFPNAESVLLGARSATQLRPLGAKLAALAAGALTPIYHAALMPCRFFVIINLISIWKFYEAQSASP
jgi:hypothetical protein